MEVTSSDDVGLVEVSDRFGRSLDVQVSFFLCGKEVPPQRSLAPREEGPQCETVGVWVVLVADSFLLGEIGLYSRTPTIHEGPSLMADLTDRTLVNVSSWLACVTGDGIYVSCSLYRPILHASQIHLR